MLKLILRLWNSILLVNEGLFINRSNIKLTSEIEYTTLETVIFCIIIVYVVDISDWIHRSKKMYPFLSNLFKAQAQVISAEQ